MSTIWVVEYTDEFAAWWETLDEDCQEWTDTVVRLLEYRGPALGFPSSSDVRGSRHGHLRELRIQCEGRAIRILYAFDPRRVAILLVGGDKTGDSRFYDTWIPIADRLYDQHVIDLEAEGLIDG